MHDPAPEPEALSAQVAGRAAVERAFRASLSAANPEQAVGAHWPREIDDEGGPPADLLLLAVGKASAGMTRESLRRVGCPARGLAVTIPEHADALTAELRGGGHGRLEVLAADHPFPTARNVAAARRLAELADSATEQTAVVVLISGGGSAQLCLPPSPLTLEDVADATRALLRAGASIGELNAVRKHADLLKGGRLAQRLRRARAIHALVLSDVLGDRLDVISSGPLAPDPTTFADALAVCERFAIERLAPAVVAHLRRSAEVSAAKSAAPNDGATAESPKPRDPCFARVRHTIVGSNALAVRAAADSLRAAGVQVLDERPGVEGEASSVARALVAGLDAARSEAAPAQAGREGAAVALVWGGETTVRVGEAPGVGGRNQEVALAAAIAIEGRARVVVGALATDGRDGPTDAAGAIVDGTSTARMRRAGIDPLAALADHDSTRALDASGDTQRTGPTGTNVNDVMIALAWPEGS